MAVAGDCGAVDATKVGYDQFLFLGNDAETVIGGDGGDKCKTARRENFVVVGPKSKHRPV
jgi:hypothetical protein